MTRQRTTTKQVQDAIAILEQYLPDDPFYIVPAAGNGEFYDLLPVERRLGIGQSTFGQLLILQLINIIGLID
jgi:hypothetical protein